MANVIFLLQMVRLSCASLYSAHDPGINNTILEVLHEESNLR